MVAIFFWLFLCIVLLVLRTGLNNSEIRYTKKLCIFLTGGVCTPYSPCIIVCLRHWQGEQESADIWRQDGPRDARVDDGDQTASGEVEQLRRWSCDRVNHAADCSSDCSSDRYTHRNTQCVSKKRPAWYCPYLCQILTDFQTSFFGAPSEKFAINRVVDIPPHLNSVAALPCEM